MIDPVDGTYNFHRGLDWWCSAVALTDGDDLVLGAVHHPASRRHLRRRTRSGEHPQRRARCAARGSPADESCATTYLHPPFYDGEIGAAFMRAVSGVATLRMMGSGTMDAIAIARGQCDVLFQHSVPDWDRLPGAAIIRGVGGESRVVHAAGRTGTWPACPPRSPRSVRP